ncbi:MAG TPA: transcriptional regulator PpsR [Methylibium sp.]|uniref:transcriptional regulator PpsR n=1 Tax=Methylibium sp. TaxID=2067992 RepID=UPI002DBB7A23|nr:transcriptional regulator PpsR [Methylibium sp.]HEU4457682.1 transcriptional regulator PpsR [Methylibium sp.]
MKHSEAPRHLLAGLDAKATASLLAVASDLALVLDADGVIRDVSVGAEDLQDASCADWVGRRWSETVTVESRPKVAALLEEAGASKAEAARKWRHINHAQGTGPDLPLLYSAIRVGGNGQVVAFGRDLRANSSLQIRLVEAQQAMERDYLRLRQMETRYRHLFQQVREAIVIVAAETLKIVELNPAAEQLLGKEAGTLVGRSIAEGFGVAARDRVAALLGGVRLSGKADHAMDAELDNGMPVEVAASLFRQSEGSMLLVRLTPPAAKTLRVVGGLAAPRQAAPNESAASLLQLVERMPDGFVVTDPHGMVLAANSSFIEMTQLATRDLVVGQPLARWLGRSEVDLGVLLSNLKQHGALRLFATRVRGAYGVDVDVEISAASVAGGEHPCLGFTVRDVGRRLNPDALKRRELPRSASQLIELVGRVPLKDIVSETTDLIEQMCIEAALELTQDNRASASEMLGLSRQSLYVKLRRYGLGDLGTEGGK